MEISQQKAPFIFCLLIILGIVSCQCEPKPLTPPIQENASPEIVPQKGIWHTGTFDKKITPIPPPNGSQAPHLYKHTFQVYRVKHDGSCGYRSFIPILLAKILERDQWKDWLEDIRTALYEPAKAILQPLDLTGTKYIQFRPTNDPDKLLADIKNLLQTLSQEPVARPLQEPEIQLLVSFLRQTILMDEVIKASKSITVVTITQEIDKFFDEPNFNTKDFWSYDDSFKIFHLPSYIILSEEAPLFYITLYRHNRTNITDYENDYSPQWFPQQAPPIWLYHYDNAYFEYLVCEEAS